MGRLANRIPSLAAENLPEDYAAIPVVCRRHTESARIMSAGNARLICALRQS